MVETLQQVADSNTGDAFSFEYEMLPLLYTPLTARGVLYSKYVFIRSMRSVYRTVPPCPFVDRVASFTAVYPGGLWNVQIATLGDDPQEVDQDKASSLCDR